MLTRIPEDLRSATIEILTEPKLTASQRRTMLLKKGLYKSTVDELEALDSKGMNICLYQTLFLTTE